MECLYAFMNVHVHIPLPPNIGTSGVGKGGQWPLIFTEGFGPLPLNGNIMYLKVTIAKVTSYIDYIGGQMTMCYSG